ncbi:MAG: PEP-CTERM sorting domain-containing protein [Verrucomicrobia bacterium]|nr:PEP-CTERM sorting domain-containing protein [Verrucomicrobiota bacterium]MCH8511815.1 PEP-CTERM sorting domain-containing protein [Kiritimatiellia bacterium]
MNKRTNPQQLRSLLAATALSAVLALSFQNRALAQDGVWTVDANGNWSVTTNWLDGIVADGADNIADFSTINILSNRTVTLDGNRTIGTMLWGDTVGAQAWILSGANTLTLETTSGTPTIHNTTQLTIGSTTTLAGSGGLLKTGGGVLVLNSASTLTGTATIRDGNLYMWGGAGLANITDVVVEGGGSIRLQNNAQRINNSASLTLRGGATGYSLLADNNSNEILGSLHLGAGRSWINMNSTATLTFADLGTVDTGSTLRVTNLGSVTFTSAPATSNGILGGWATSVLNDTTAGNFLRMDGNQVAEYISSGTEVSTDSTAWQTTDNVRVSTNPDAAVTTRTINSLNIDAARTVTIAANETLTLASGGLIVRTNGNAVTGGTLASTGDMHIHGGRTGNETTIASALDVGSGNLVVSGTGNGSTGTFGWIILNNANNSFGDVYVNNQTLRLDGDVGAFGDQSKTVYLNNGNIGNHINNATYDRNIVVGLAGGGLTSTTTVHTTWTGEIEINGLFTIDTRGQAGDHTFTNTISGEGGIRTLGNRGVITLAGDNTYTGSTDITGGSATFPKTVNLTGSLANSNIIIRNEGTLFQGDGMLTFNLGDDLIRVLNGTLDVSEMNIQFAGLATAEEYLLIDYSGGGTFIGSVTGTTDFTFLNASNRPAGYQFFHDEVNQQVLLVIPEPGTLVLLGIALGSLLLFRRRR